MVSDWLMITLITATPNPDDYLPSSTLYIPQISYLYNPVNDRDGRGYWGSNQQIQAAFLVNGNYHKPRDLYLTGSEPSLVNTFDGSLDACPVKDEAQIIGDCKCDQAQTLSCGQGPKMGLHRTGSRGVERVDINGYRVWARGVAPINN